MSQITHRFISAKSDSTDATLINPSNWNAVHDLVWTDEYITATAGQTVFTPAVAPISSAFVFVNGLKARAGASYDYTIVGVTVVFNYPLDAGQVVEIIQ